MVHPEKQQTLADRAAVERFLVETRFDPYQSIELPHGLKTPGHDRGRSGDLIFRHPLANKSVLDIGCKYGFFCHEAFKRGARRVVGVDLEEHNVQVATKIAELWGREIRFSCSDLSSLSEEDSADVVFFLNVLHHILDPVAALQKLASLAGELLILEISTLYDAHTRIPRPTQLLMKLLLRNTPLAYVGPRKYHRVWYFSPAALENLIARQMDLFSHIEFARSPQKRGRVLAYCWK